MWVNCIAIAMLVGWVTPTFAGDPPRDEHSIVFKLQPLDAKLESPVVTAMTLSPDRQWLAVSGDDHAIRMIRLQDCITQATLLGHSDWVRSIEFSRDGKWLASVGNDGELRVWSTDSVSDQTQGRVLAKEEHALTMVAFHPDSDRLFIAGFHTEIECWSLSAGQKLWSVTSSTNDNRALRISPNGELLAWGGRDGIVHVYDVNEKSFVIQKPLHRDRIRSVEFSIDSTRILSIGEDRKFCRYDLPADVLTLEKQMQTGKLMSMAIVDLITTAIGGSDNLIHFHTLVDNRELGAIAGHRGTISILCCDDAHLVSSGYDTTIRVWNWKDIWETIETSPAPPELSARPTIDATVR